jgi:hypothetical protein
VNPVVRSDQELTEFEAVILAPAKARVDPGRSPLTMFAWANAARGVTVVTE